MHHFSDEESMVCTATTTIPSYSGIIYSLNNCVTFEMFLVLLSTTGNLLELEKPLG